MDVQNTLRKKIKKMRILLTSTYVPTYEYYKYSDKYLYIAHFKEVVSSYKAHFTKSFFRYWEINALSFCS